MDSHRDYMREIFHLEALRSEIHLSDVGFLDSAEVTASLTRMGIAELRAYIFAKQPARIFWQPPARLVRSWGEPRSWFQRLKMKRGLGWLRWFGEVRLSVEVERFVPPVVEVTGRVYYPEYATKRHVTMGTPVLSMNVLEPYPGGGSVSVEYAAHRQRPLWVDEKTHESLRRLAKRLDRGEEHVLMIALYDMAERHGAWSAL